MSRRSGAAAGTALGVVLLVLLGWGAWQDASVADEHPHLLSGLLAWQGNASAGGFDNPPLGQLWIAWPHHLLQLPYAFPSDDTLVWARLPVILLTLLLACLVSVWAQRMGGVSLGLLVLGVFCLEPTLLAHGHLATLDLPLACAWWATLWFLRQWVLGSARAAVGFCLAFAAAVLIKFTGLLLLPVCVVVGLLTQRGVRGRVHLAVLLGVAGATTWVVALLVYGTDGLHGGLPPAFVDALAGKWQHRQEGHFSYLAGRRSLQGFPEYNLVALAVKTPVPLLLLAAWGIVVGWRSWSRVDRALLLVPPVLLMALFSWGGVNIGVRHLLPLHPALLVCAAWGLLWLLRGVAWMRGVALGVGLWWVATTAWSAPQWLAYFNVVAGGPAHGDAWLLDSNLDWGQDDRRLQLFLEAQAQQGRTWQVDPPGEMPLVGDVLVNVNTLHGLLRPRDDSMAWLRRQPVASHVGWSWNAYSLSLDGYRQKYARHPEDEDRLADLALALHGANRSEEALTLIRAHGPLHALSARRAAARIALESGHLDAARDWIRNGDRTDARWAALSVRLQLQEQLLAASTRADSAAAMRELGILWAETGDLQRALPWLQRAARLLETDAETQAAWVVGLTRSGDYATASAVARAPGVAAALSNEAEVLQRLAATRQQLGTVLRDGGTMHTEALWELARIEFENQLADRAAQALVQILRQDPADRDALHLLGELQVRSKLRVLSERLTPRPVRPFPEAHATKEAG